MRGAMRAVRQLQRSASPSVALIGAPFSRGQPLQGAEKAPEQLRAAGLLQKLQQQGCAVKDYGNLVFDERPEEPMGILKNVRAIGGANQLISEAVRVAKQDGHTVALLGGDHSIAIGSIHGHWQAVGRVGVVWVDAHSDVNTPLTTPSGNFHGQPVSYLLHELSSKIPNLPNFSWIKPCLTAQDLVYIGLRDVDPPEHFILKHLGVKFYSISDVDRLGIGRVMEETCDHLDHSGKTPIHLSYDVDGIDPTVTPATGTPVVGGLTYREGIYIAEQLFQTGRLSVVDLVEVNLLKAQTEDGARSTLDTAVQLLLACFGRLREGNHAANYQLPEP